MHPGLCVSGERRGANPAEIKLNTLNGGPAFAGAPAALPDEAGVQPAGIGTFVGLQSAEGNVRRRVDVLADLAAEFDRSLFIAPSGQCRRDRACPPGRVPITLEAGELDALRVVAVGIHEEIGFLEPTEDRALVVGFRQSRMGDPKSGNQRAGGADDGREDAV